MTSEIFYLFLIIQSVTNLTPSKEIYHHLIFIDRQYDGHLFKFRFMMDKRHAKDSKNSY